MRGRLGYAADRVLFYGTAGGAVGDVTAGQSAGWTAGAGLEAALTENLTARIEYLYLKLGNILVENLSAKVEYDFYDFGSKNYNFSALTPVSVKSNLHTIIVGLNCRFNWSGGPKS